MSRLLSISAQPEFGHLTSLKRHSDWCSLKYKYTWRYDRQLAVRACSRLTVIQRGWAEYCDSVSGEQINFFCRRRSQICFYIYLNLSLIACFSTETVVTIMLEQNAIWSETLSGGITFQQTTIWRQLIASHVGLGQWNERKNESTDVAKCPPLAPSMLYITIYVFVSFFFLSFFFFCGVYDATKSLKY